MRKKHNERCKDCKIHIEELLKTLYGEVFVNHNLDLPCRIDDYSGLPFESDLSNIYNSLQKYRGYEVFVKAKKLLNVDFFVPREGIIVEFDESQHFTKAREISLSYYPKKLDLGFSISKWKDLCIQLNKKDNDPPYRDEQRAWYDTLRDFAPSKLGIKRTIRLYASDYVWCSLDPNKKTDVKQFEKLLGFVS